MYKVGNLLCAILTMFFISLNLLFALFLLTFNKPNEYKERIKYTIKTLKRLITKDNGEIINSDEAPWNTQG